MRVGVCSVGTELLTGDQVDTNAAWVSARLGELGATAGLHLAVGDDLDDMVAAMRWLLGRCDALVVGGGLGPTPDDLTREAVARLADVPLEHRDDLEAAIRDRFAAHGARMSDNNLRQARVPRGATPWPPAGTAPGFAVEVDGRPVWVLPGVPWELRRLFDAHVAPDVLARTGARATVTRVVHVTSMGESQVADALAAVEQRAGDDGVAFAYLATGSEIQVRVTASGDDREAAAGRAGRWVDEVVGVLGVAVAGTDGTTVEQAVHDLLRAAGATVAAAESATAGLVCSRLATVPGSSTTFRGGAVAYATDTKAAVVGIDPALLDTHAPVSRPVTTALARAVRERFAADYGVATTGVAGPSDQDGVPVGTCVWAVCGPDGEVDVMERVVPGDRDAVRGRLATAALETLRRRLLADLGDPGAT
jgi:nicotinamide-nucleotide amidase